tara:strand:- start:107 stop:904 length:798 start_codon:yes stop_codon:yes gene_type:complete
MKDINKLSREELKFLSEKKPSLIPIKVPSIDEANLLNQPTLDQIIVQFLQQYEVNVEPRSVGEWNGWDTVSTLSSILSSREGSMSNVASTMFYANRSNQINSAAQDWGTWKRWVFDSKEREFNLFKNEVIESINIHNKEIIAQTEEKIREAESNNQKVLAALEDPYAKKTIAELKELAKENLGKNSFLYSIFGTILFLMMIVIVYADGPTMLVGFIALIMIIINLFSLGTGVKFLFSNSKKKYFGIIGTCLSAALLTIIISAATS